MMKYKFEKMTKRNLRNSYNIKFIDPIYIYNKSQSHKFGLLQRKSRTKRLTNYMYLYMLKWLVSKNLSHNI